MRPSPRYSTSNATLNDNKKIPRNNFVTGNFFAHVSDGNAVFNRLGKRDAVGARKIRADRQSSRQFSDFDARRIKQSRYKQRSRIALNRRLERDNHFFYFIIAHTLYQFAQPNIILRNARQRRNQPARHVIFAVESSGAFDSVKVFGVFDNADNFAVALVRGADVADNFVGINRVKTNFASVSIELD